MHCIYVGFQRGNDVYGAADSGGDDNVSDDNDDVDCAVRHNYDDDDDAVSDDDDDRPLDTAALPQFYGFSKKS